MARRPAYSCLGLLLAPPAAFALMMGVFAAFLTPPSAQAFDFTRTLQASADSALVFRGRRLGGAGAGVGGFLTLGDGYLSAQYLWAEDDDDALPGADWTEFRGQLGWRRTLPPRLSVDVGAAVYAGDSDGAALNAQDRLEVYAGLVAAVPLNPAAFAYVDPDEETVTVEAGLYERVDLPALFALRGAADVGRVFNGVAGAEDYTYAQAEADVVRDFLFGVEAYVGVRASTLSEEAGFLAPEDAPAGATLDLDDDVEFWGGAGLSWSF